MADAFAPQLGSSVQFVQPVEDTSTATLISGATQALKGFMSSRPEPEPKGPMGSAGNPDVALSNYTKDLSTILQTAEDRSPNAIAIAIRKLNIQYAGDGIDVTSAPFKTARENLTGRTEETLMFSQEELVYNDLVKTPEGQAKLTIAERELMALNDGVKPKGEDTINYIVKKEAEKQAFDRLKIENEMAYAAAAPQFQMQVANMGNQFLASLDIIEENGLRIDDPEMLQNSYLSYQAERNRIISKIPLGLPNREQEIKNLFQVTDEFFASMGIDAGNFERLPKSQLDLKRKAIIAVEMLNNMGDTNSAMLATGILNANYKMTDELMFLVQETLKGKELIDPTPEWVTDAGIVVSNDMVTVAQQLSTIGAQAIKTVADHEAALTDLVGADVAEKWGSLTSEQAWKDLQATTGIYKGFSRDAILNGQVSTDIPYQMAFKLAMGLKTIDFENEAVSFGGLRKSVDASLPGTLDALEAKDPEKGKAARTLLYVATGKAARQYEAQITAEEQRFGMSFNPSIRGYSFNYATIADENNRQIISRIVEEQYGGDIIRAVEDKFARAGGGALRYGRASTTTGAALAALPSLDDMKRLLDLRNSAVYLDSLSRSIEPEDFRVAREMGRDAFSTTEAQAIGMGAIEAIANAPLPGEITTETIPAGGAGSQSTSTSPIVSVVEAGEGFITVRRQNGTEERLEGNRASRNNNPGNIQYGEFAKSAGAIGTDGRFAVFPSYEVGRAAKKKLLWDTKSYSGKTIEEAINRYAPPSENDTKSYVKTVSSAVGVPANTPMSSLSEDQKEVMLDAMERVEGFSGPVFSSSKGPDAASYFNVDKNNLPTGGSIVEIGSAKVVANSSMKPLLNSTAGASSLIKQGADVRLASVLQGPFQDLQKNFGSALVINDGLAKKGTSREKQTPGSRHFHGDALDISTVGMSDEDKLRLVDAALEAGFQGFGFGKNILHIDLGAKRAWAYGNDTFGGVPVADLKTRVQSSSVSPAEISMDPRSPQPSAGGDITTPEVDDKEGAPTGFTLFSDDFNVSPNVTTTTSTAPEAMAANTAALPEAIPAETPTGTQGASELSPAIAVDKDVQAFIQEIAGDPDKSYETEAEFVAAQERGELEPGDTVVVNGDVYVIRKNGTARRLGAVK